MANIFDIVWTNVTENLLPWFWRQSVLLAYLRSIIKPVQDISDETLALQNATTLFLDYTGQHLALEEYLNDTYDALSRRIFITENDIGAIDSIEIYLSGETTDSPLELYMSGETPLVPVGIYKSNEALVDNNFTVNIPSSIVFDLTLITAQLRNYVTASRNFNFVTF